MYYTFYSNNFKCVFIPLAKSASSSLKVWIYQLEDLNYKPSIDNEGPRTVYLSKSDFENRFKNYLKFTCVRNPFSRLVSCYLDKFVFSKFKEGNRLEQISSSKIFQRNLDNFDKIEQWGIKNMGSSYEEGITFEIFLHAINASWMSSASKERLDSHWASQYELGYFDYISYDLVFHVESLSSDIKLLEKKLDVPEHKKFNMFRNKRRISESVNSKIYFGNITAAKLSRSSDCTKVSEKNFYTEETIKVVQQKFEKDLKYFGYGKDYTYI